MGVSIKGLKSTNISKDLITNYIGFLNSELKLTGNIIINLIQNRDGDMTTGVRKNDEICILVEGRLPIDIFRTIGHEWVHEYQHQKMGLSDNKQIQDIGGPEENMANTLAGIFIKKFVKEFPQYEEQLYSKD
jgi:hypothetical protein